MNRSRRPSSGQLLADPQIKPLKDSILEQLDQASKEVKAKLGVTLQELAELPQGPVSIAVVGITKPDAKIPVALLVSADAGKNAATMTDVMMKSTKQAEEAGAKVASAEFKGLCRSTSFRPPRTATSRPLRP